MTLKTTPFDAHDYFDTVESQLELIREALEEGDPAFLKVALNTVARARNMSAIAEEAGVTRAGLYKALSEDGDPRLSTLMGIMKALGVKLSVAPPNSPNSPAPQ
jgi:probable addiction module antidote protein